MKEKQPDLEQKTTRWVPCDPHWRTFLFHTYFIVGGCWIYSRVCLKQLWKSSHIPKNHPVIWWISC